MTFQKSHKLGGDLGLCGFKANFLLLQSHPPIQTHLVTCLQIIWIAWSLEYYAKKPDFSLPANKVHLHNGMCD